MAQNNAVWDVKEMTLFDDITRSDQRPARDNESLFDYCNTSGRHSVDGIRTILETWFQRIPESAQIELRARFRSHTDSQHQSAFFEIYLHELLCCMGFTATPHPNVPGNVRTHPDFVVLQGDMACFYLEATLALPSGDETAENARIAQVYDTLNAMESPNFFLAIRLQALRQHLLLERVYAATSRGGCQILIQIYWGKH
jgi:hypothetical protein